YSSGENYEHLEVRGLTGYIPAHGMYKAERTGFTYDAASDSYTCSQGKLLTFHKVFVDSEGHAKKRYMAKTADCQSCPLREQCKGKKAKQKRLHHTPHKAHYDRLLACLATRLGRRLLRLRAATVEPVLGSLITCYGLRQISKKGQAGAAKVLYLAAMAYNLKKYLRAAAPSNRLAWPSPCQYPVTFFGA
ncbi:MAG: IS1182 family transposase, partial [Hymenobacter sp.]